MLYRCNEKYNAQRRGSIVWLLRHEKKHVHRDYNAELEAKLKDPATDPSALLDECSVSISLQLL